MSDQSKNRKDEARDCKEPLELPEETLPEETLPEETLPEETLPEELWSEELWPEELWPEGLWPEGSQVEEPRTEESRAEESQTAESQTVESQAEEPQAEEPQAEEPQAEEPQAEEPQAEEPQAEEPQAEEPQAEEPQAEEPQAEEPQAEEPQAEEPQAKRAKPKKKQRILMIIMIVLAVAAIIATALVLLHNRWFKKPVLPPPPSQSGSGIIPSASVPSNGPGDGPEATTGIYTVQPLAGGERRSEDFFTILIFGTDQVSGLTDTIMVASYDVTNQRAAVLSIPRDTLVNNYYFDKANMSINAAYSQNGQGEQGTLALKTEVSRLIGFVPDFYVTIDWELVGKMVDAIGGVYYNIPWHMGYDDPTQDLHIHFEAGHQYLDGEAAMNLVRWRQNNDGVYGGGDGSDLIRLNVQHDFLKAVLEQTLRLENIVHIPELIRLFNANVVSDLVVENMLWFGEQAVKGGLSADDVEFVTMPVYGTDNIYGRYYGKVCPVTDQLLTIVNRSLNPYVENVTMRQLDLLQMSADGNTLSSTTGVLRNPAAGEYTPPVENPGPEESDPLESDPMDPDPTESDPTASDPAESDPINPDPAESDPINPDPAESDPTVSDPAENDPGPDQTDDPPPETGPALPEVDGPDGGNWGDTPD